LALSYADERGNKTSLADQIVAGAITVLPGVTSAVVEIPDKQGRLTSPLAAGDPVAVSGTALQHQSGEGPGVSALRDGIQIMVDDLVTDDRWPRFSREIAPLGVAAMVCTPMQVAGRSVGVLTLYSDRPGFGEHDGDIADLARVFAAHAGVALAGAQRIGNLTAAMDSRDVIGQAKGVLMERFRLTPDAAFAVLVRASSESNTKLRTVCVRLCETGELAGRRRIQLAVETSSGLVGGTGSAGFDRPYLEPLRSGSG
jgi:GAF domain-containing protein